jgi:hypothetical protein
MALETGLGRGAGVLYARSDALASQATNEPTRRTARSATPMTAARMMAARMMAVSMRPSRLWRATQLSQSGARVRLAGYI